MSDPQPNGKTESGAPPVNGSGTGYAILTAVAFISTVAGLIYMIQVDWRLCAIAFDASTTCLWLRTFLELKSPNNSKT